VALLEKRRYLNNRSGDFPQVILIVPSHVPNTDVYLDLSQCGIRGSADEAVLNIQYKITWPNQLEKKDICTTQEKRDPKPRLCVAM
jgi:hypothetical protein